MSETIVTSVRVPDPSEFDAMTILGPEQLDRLATRVLCPVCGATGGEWCKTPTGANASRAHAARRRLAICKPVLP
jgi:hypothetical protein